MFYNSITNMTHFHANSNQEQKNSAITDKPDKPRLSRFAFQVK